MHMNTKTLSALADAALPATPGLYANEVEFEGDFDLRGYAGDEEKTALLPDTHHAGYLRLGTKVGRVLPEGKAAFVLDGGNVSPGFDTFSSLINNSPEHTASATNVAALNIGGLGAEVDRYLFAARASPKVTDRRRVKGAMGWGLCRAPRSTWMRMSSSTICRPTHYRVNRDITAWETVGLMDSKDLLGENHAAASLNLRTTF